ncbi:Cellular tumor antigen p53 [Orchesella cincta]|uniref:Cellular tumor antigen p53 n=1 Tax=Orchesella cincta TaxID=48709 RepID=A0A1D2NAH9_ORCCI|nr:Cellular tumor antigen p53 [Orchesella cincta]
MEMSQDGLLTVSSFRSSQLLDSQDVYAEDNSLLGNGMSNFTSSTSGDVMLSNPGNPTLTNNWAAAGTEVKNPNNLAQLLGVGGLTDSDLETFNFGHSDSDVTLSQVLSSDLMNVDPLGSTGNELRELGIGVAQQSTTTTIVQHSSRAIVDYLQPPTPSASGNNEIARGKIFNDDIITLEDWRGRLNFTVSPDIDTNLAKKNLYLKEENKLFCKMGIAIPFKIELNFGKIKDANDYLIRASLVFTDPNDVNKPVSRCSSHAVEEGRLEGDTDNQYRLSHILRPSQPLKDTLYFIGPSERCYLLTNLKFPEPGTTSLNRSYVFTCLSSCKGDTGINRRPISLMFCLFDKKGTLFGRRLIKVRVCSAPLRDYQKEMSERGTLVNGRKRKSATSTQVYENDSSKRPIVGKVPLPSSPAVVRCVVTAGKKKMEEEVSSSQEVYSGAESDQRIPLRQLIQDVRWALSMKRSDDIILQSYATHIYNSLRMTWDLCNSARDHEHTLLEQNKVKDEKSPDGGFHEEGQD